MLQLLLLLDWVIFDVKFGSFREHLNPIYFLVTKTPILHGDQKLYMQTNLRAKSVSRTPGWLSGIMQH